MKQVIAKRQDIAFYIFMTPIAQLHPQAVEKSKTILCEKDNAKALKLLEDVFDKKDIGKPSCSSDVVDRNVKIMRDAGVSGTPTLIFMDGSRIPGAAAADQIIQKATAK